MTAFTFGQGSKLINLNPDPDTFAIEVTSREDF
jgi:hypothetical protein